MSSSEKGKDFEDNVFGQIQDLVNKEEFGVLPKSCRIFKRKGYFSRDRNSHIIVDISLEIWLPKAKQWSFLIVVECKSYSSTISVNEVEELKAKLDQIGGVNVKGIFATNAFFQKSALEYAKSNGMGVVRIFPDNQISHILFQREMGSAQEEKMREIRETIKAITTENYRPLNNEFYGITNTNIHNYWTELIKEMIINI